MHAHETQRAWVLRLDYRLEDCLKNNYVAVGWCRASEAMESEDWEDFKQTVQYHYPYASNQALGNAAGSFWRFLFEMQTGDLLVIPIASAFFVAQIESAAFFDSKATYEEDSSWRRKVSWLTNPAEPIKRTYVANDLQRRLRARQTCVQADDFVSEIFSALERKAPLNLASAIREEALSIVTEAVDRVMNNRDLERLVMVLVEAAGFEATIPSRRQTHEGDVDVRATINLPAPAGSFGGDTTVSVGYQVKHHDDVTGIKGLEQIADAVESGAVDYGVLVTSADRFSDEVKTRVERSLSEETEGEDRYKRIWLIDRNALAEWVLDVGLDHVDSRMTIAQ